MAKEYDVYFKDRRMKSRTYLISSKDDLDYLLKFLSTKGLKNKIKFIGHQGKVVWRRN